MKKFLALAAVLAMSAPLTAFAADLPQPPPPPPRAPAFVPAPPFTWTGFYVGINGGYSWNNWTDNIGDSFNANGGIVGGTVGFNYQWNWFVAGFEADIDWADNKFNQNFSDVPFGGSTIGTLNYKNDILSTFAARFGVAADHALFYGKAGGAWTQEKFSITATDPAFGVLSESDSFSRLGWMVGAGVEYAVTNNLTLKAEYNYINFGSNNETLNATVTGGTVVGPGAVAAVVASKPNMNVVKVGVNWLFNGAY